MATIVLPNGIVLDDDEGMVPTLQSHANRRGLARLRVFVATHPSGVQNYLLVDGETPIFESQSSEAVSAHIDMMYLEETLP